jgi:hypothetical protein
VTKVDDVIALATAQEGKPYVYGDEGPDTFDCSGLMQYCFGLVGISLPRTSQEQQAWATPVKSPLPGDLVFYGQPATHVGLYLGGGKMIDAPDVGKNVEVDNVGTPTSYGRVKGLGTAAAPAVSTVAAVTAGTGDVLAGLLPGSDLLGSVADGLADNLHKAVLIGVALVLAIGLVAYGAYRSATAGRESTRGATA